MVMLLVMLLVIKVYNIRWEVDALYRVRHHVTGAAEPLCAKATCTFHRRRYFHARIRRGNVKN